MKVPPLWVLAAMAFEAVVATLIFAFAFHLGLYALLDGALLLTVSVSMASRAYGIRSRSLDDAADTFASTFRIYRKGRPRP